MDRVDCVRIVHKTVNVLNKLPKSQQPKAKRALQDIWMAETKPEARVAFDAFVETYGVKYDKAVACLVTATRCSPSTTSPPSTGNTYGPRTRSRARSRRSAIARCAPGLPIEQDRARDDLQAGRGRREELAAARWSPPLAQ